MARQFVFTAEQPKTKSLWMGGGGRKEGRKQEGSEGGREGGLLLLQPDFLPSDPEIDSVRLEKMNVRTALTVKGSPGPRFYEFPKGSQNYFRKVF